jgi:hypothetical protein
MWKVTNYWYVKDKNTVMLTEIAVKISLLSLWHREGCMCAIISVCLSSTPLLLSNQCVDFHSAWGVDHASRWYSVFVFSDIQTPAIPTWQLCELSKWEQL